jgi:dimethylamine monooxygenase subunit A
LPISGAVLFSIHTYIVRHADLTPEQAAGLAEHPIHISR